MTRTFLRIFALTSASFIAGSAFAAAPSTLSSASLPPLVDEPVLTLRPVNSQTGSQVDDLAGSAAVIAPIYTAAGPVSDQAKPILMAENMITSAMVDPGPIWNLALKKYISAPDAAGLARFDYAALKSAPKDVAALEAYIDDLENQKPETMGEDRAIAYWANLYNAVTVKVIIDNYPVNSIKDIKSGVFSSGPWKKDLITVNGTKMSLDDVEHKTLRKQYPSPLIHYMVNCASVGCPNLKDGLWTAETLDADRDVAARSYINSPRGAKITDKGLVVSSIYDWFETDFGGNKKGVLAHLSEYAEGDLKAAIEGGAKISGYDYDWSLNE